MSRIAISAGHDNKRRGACFNNVCEHDLTVPWQHALLTYLGSNGVRVPPDLPLRDKIAWINADRTIDMAVEIHFNSDAAHKGSGCETLYAPRSRKGKALAETVQAAMSSFCAPNRGAKEGWYRMDRPGHVDYAGDIDGDETVDAFLGRTRCPAIIVEPFFIHEQARILALREVVCEVMADALQHYTQRSDS